MQKMQLLEHDWTFSANSIEKSRTEHDWDNECMQILQKGLTRSLPAAMWTFVSTGATNYRAQQTQGVWGKVTGCHLSYSGIINPSSAQERLRFTTEGIAFETWMQTSFPKPMHRNKISQLEGTRPERMISDESGHLKKSLTLAHFGMFVSLVDVKRRISQSNPKTEKRKL